MHDKSGIMFFQVCEEYCMVMPWGVEWLCGNVLAANARGPGFDTKQHQGIGLVMGSSAGS